MVMAVVTPSKSRRLLLSRTTRGALCGRLCPASTPVLASPAVLVVLVLVLVVLVLPAVLFVVVLVMVLVLVVLLMVLLLHRLLSASLTSLCGSLVDRLSPTGVRARTIFPLSSTLSVVPSTDFLSSVLNSVSCLFICASVYSLCSLSCPLFLSSLSSLSASISLTACRAFLGQCAFLLLSLVHSSTALSASVAVPSFNLLFTAM